MATETGEASKPRKFSASEGLIIEKGPGTQLKHIPNVAFKLSKRKPDDENLHMLHSILFGKTTKAHNLKKNIGQFSGYVWAENEEKQRTRVNGRIYKCMKEKLVDFCDVLDIPIKKTRATKMELAVKLFEFLESPHVTTDVLLTEKEQAHNLKKNIGQFSGYVWAENEKQKQSSESGKKRKHSSDVEDYEVSKAKEDTSKALKRTSRKGGKAASKTSKTPPVKDQVKGVSSKKAKIEPSNEEMRAGVTDILKKEVGTFIRTSEIIEKLGTHFGLDLMHRKVEVMAIIRNVILGESASPSKSKQQDTNGNATSKTSKTLEDQGKGISSKKVNVEPSKEEMIPVVVDILKVVPLGVGLSDIVEKLGTHFGLDLMHRKEEVKAIMIHVLLHYNDGEVGEAAVC